MTAGIDTPDRHARTGLDQHGRGLAGNGHPDGMLLETAAGLLDGDSPEDGIRREAAEETGRHIGEARHVFDVYMSPGSVTERLHFFAAPYTTRPPPSAAASPRKARTSPSWSFRQRRAADDIGPPATVIGLTPQAESALDFAGPERLPAETARWSTITQIYEGTNQIQRVVVARQLLKGG